MKVIFGKEYGLFRETEEHSLYPSPSHYQVSGNYEEQYRFAGRMLAKMIYESILVDIPFAHFFLTKILSKKNKFDDLFSYDKSLYNNLLNLKSFHDVDSLDLNFTVVNHSFGRSQVVELKSGGNDILVTSKNLLDYIFSIANYRINLQIKKQTTAFLKGFIFFC